LDSEDGKIQLELFTRVPDYETPGNPTRMGSALETTVGTTPWVIVFKGAGDGATYVEAAQSYVLGGKTWVDINSQTSACRILILANPQPKFTDTAGTEYDFSVANFNAVLAPGGSAKTIAQACELLHTQSLTATTHGTVPYVNTSIPMSAIFDTPNISGAITIGTDEHPFPLTRAVARVVVTNTATNFVMQGATVLDTPRRGRLHKLGTTLKTNPLPADRTDYLTATANSQVTGIATATAEGAKQTTDPTAAASKNPLYVYESSKAEALHTHIIVQGVYDGRTNYYKLSLRDPNAGATDPNAAIDIVRGTNYTINITSVKRSGYSTLTDAMNAAHSSNEDVVWRVNVTDAYSHDIVDNGEYYLGVTNSQFKVYADGAPTNKHAFTITTNRTAALTDNSITVSSGLTLAAPTTGKITLGGSTDVRLNFTTGFTSGTVTLRLGDLTKVITVQKLAPLAGVIPVSGQPLRPKGGSLSFPGILSAQIEGGARWITLSTDGTVHTGNYIHTSGGGTVYILTDHNAAEIRADRTMVCYLSQVDETAGRIKLDITQKGEFYGGYADIVWMDADEDYRLKIARYGDGSGITSDRMASVQFGGVIAFYNNGDWNTSTSLRFNPTTRTSIGWTALPNYSSSNGNGNAWKTSVNDSPSVSSPEYHNEVNLAAGKGDICKLVGLNSPEAKARVASGTLASYNSGWRLPTARENANFVGGAATHSTWIDWRLGIDEYRYTDGADNNTTRWHFWERSGAPTKTGSYPVVADAFNAAFTQVLPGIKHRQYQYGTIVDTSTRAHYWSSNPRSKDHGYNMTVGPDGTTPTHYSNQGYGMSIRCIRDLQRW
jgi:uncharacterized protein (TIGR02145 family)